ncbi:MAG: cupin domain-containing protein [Desulfarculaceae bacterium]|nr:cupin domain-containing protein [Desulfarculaceae bacterium]MCF8072170.1 cupin domain-containing protein [Desulfarculaceae bacterium]MCF8100091.1 cupin domain-containing protein [Desulfarculaceae bacterium]MCF8117934.1 cupin domain-containing protein [Desulfarculaceae bacterium]
METIKALDVEDVVIKEFPYRGKMYEVKGVSVRWLSKCGDDGHGYPEYGLRLFTAQPGGEIPIHNHFYHQTMYILEGEFECYAYDSESDELIETKLCGPGSSIYIPSLEAHGMKNLSDKPGAFLCCIANVYENEQGVL